jgi:DNA-binding CsgD family transcriptional regulator
MLEGALDMVCLGIVLARRGGEVMYANLSSRQFLADYSLVAPGTGNGQPGGLRLRGRLGALVKSLGVLSECWSSPNGRLLAEIIPLQQSLDHLGILGRRGGAMLLMQERGNHKLPAPQHLMGLFGLTAAEARTCLMLCQVDSVAQCAEHLNVSLATVRSQVQAAMHKTSTSKQAELISVVLSVPAGRLESGGASTASRVGVPVP